MLLNCFKIRRRGSEGAEKKEEEEEKKKKKKKKDANKEATATGTIYGAEKRMRQSSTRKTIGGGEKDKSDAKVSVARIKQKTPSEPMIRLIQLPKKSMLHPEIRFHRS